MSPLSRVLILSASYGEGHQQAANAVRDALAILSPSTEVQIMDYMRAVHPLLDSVAKYCYLKSVRFAPALYAMWYKGTMKISPSSLIQRQLNTLGISDLEDKLDQYKPDVVLATFPTPAGVVSHLKTQGRANVPLATIITDHAVHSQWIHPQTDMYFVGSESVRRGLVKRGIDSQIVRVTGIPVRPAFLKAFDKEALREKYGIDQEVPIVLIMGGAYGVMGDIHQVCDELFNYPTKVQVLVVTGRNHKMKAQLDVAAQNARNPVKIFGFVKEVDELMAISDLVLTKAGGLTISEAVAVQLPMLLYRPIPGQEVQNAMFLVRSGVAVLARNRKEVSEHLHNLLVANPEKRLSMKHKAAAIRKTESAREIALGLIELSSHANQPKNGANYLHHN